MVHAPKRALKITRDYRMYKYVPTEWHIGHKASRIYIVGIIIRRNMIQYIDFNENVKK